MSTGISMECIADGIARQFGRNGREYLRKMRRFHYLLGCGEEPGAWIITERTVVDQAQVPSGKDRRDLGEVVEAFDAESECRGIVEAALAGELDRAGIERLGGTVLEHGDDSSTVEFVVEGSRNWPDALGGAGGSGEIERRFTLHVRRAAWRDRRVRRLARVVAVALEIQPDPDKSEL